MNTKPKTKALNALNLKQQLWDTLNKLRSGKLDVNEAAATSGIAREIIRCVNTQLTISRLTGSAVPMEIIDFNGKIEGD